MPITNLKERRVSFWVDSDADVKATFVVDNPKTDARTDVKQNPSRPVSFFSDQQYSDNLERHNSFLKDPFGSLSVPSLPPQALKNSMGDFQGLRRAVMPSQPNRLERSERLISNPPSESSKNSLSIQGAIEQGAIEISNNALPNLQLSTPLINKFSRFRIIQEIRSKRVEQVRSKRLEQGGSLIVVEQKPRTPFIVYKSTLDQSNELRRLMRSQAIDEFSSSAPEDPEHVPIEKGTIDEFSSPAPEDSEHVPIEKEAILKCLLTLHHNKGSIKFLETKEDSKKTNRKLFAFSNIFSRCFRVKDDQEKLEEYVFVSRDKVFLVKCSKQIFDQVNNEVISSKSEESDSSKLDSISPEEKSIVFGKKQFNREDGIVKLAIADIKKSKSPLKYHLKSIKKAQEELLNKEDGRKLKESLLEYLLIMSHHYHTAVDLGCIKKKDSSSLNCCFKGKIKKTKDQDSTLQNYFFVLKDQFFVISCSKEDYVRFKNKVIGENKHQSQNVAIDDEASQILDSKISFVGDDKSGFKKILLRDKDHIEIDKKLLDKIVELSIKLKNVELDSFKQSLESASREVDFESEEFSINLLSRAPSDPDARSLSADSERCIYV